MPKPRHATPATTDWSQPQQISDVMLAFPASVIGTLLPPMSEIPQEFHDSRNPWCKIASDLFFNGGHLPKSRHGVDRNNAARHLRAVLGSFEPKHEHKEAGAAYLMSLWYVLP